MTYLQEKSTVWKWTGVTAVALIRRVEALNTGRSFWEPQQKRLYGTNNDIKTYFLFVKTYALMKILVKKPTKKSCNQTHM